MAQDIWTRQLTSVPASATRPLSGSFTPSSNDAIFFTSVSPRFDSASARSLASKLSSRGQFPPEILREIAAEVLRGSGASNLIQFMLACKHTKSIGEPVLYHSVRLGHITTLAEFKAVAESILADKAPFIFEIMVPDSFVSGAEAGDLAFGKWFLESLVNLKQLAFRDPAGGRHMIAIFSLSLAYRIAIPSFWKAEMFSNVTFKLERLIGAPSDPATFRFLWDTQPHIRAWMVIGGYCTVPQVGPGWCPPPLETLCLSITHRPGSPREISCSMPIGDETFRAGIKKVLLRGKTSAGTLLLYPALRSLSIFSDRPTGQTYGQMLTSIIENAPTLQDLALWTDGDDLMTGCFSKVSLLQIATADLDA